MFNSEKTHKKFEMKIGGAALKAAIKSRLDSEETRFDDYPDEPSPQNPIEHVRYTEKRVATDKWTTLELVVDNLVDDELYVVTTEDLRELTVPSQPFAADIVGPVLAMVETFSGKKSGSDSAG